MIGPAIAYVMTELFLIAFLANKIMSSYNVPLSQLFAWKKVQKILAVNILCLPILFLSNVSNANAAATAIILSLLFVLAYLSFFKLVKIAEVDRLMKTLLQKVKWAW